MREVTADELAQALDAAPDDDYDWPYIDADGADVIDGRLSAVAAWLCENYAVTPRSEEAAPEAVAKRREEARLMHEREVVERRSDWLAAHPLERTESGLRRKP